MNKIYKVIWSKAKHTYVVASEIAKGHTKGETTGKGLKKLAAAMLVAAALLSPNFAWAEEAVTIKVEPAPDTATGTVEVYTKDGAINTFATIGNLSTVSTEVQTQATEINTNTTNINGLTTRVIALESSTVKVGGKVDKAVAADSAELATKAEQDGAGNVIISTYATKTEVSQKADASAVTDEASAREAGDKALDDRITAVKNYVLKETGDNYVSKADAAVQDAGVVKADKKIGENVTALGKGLYDETAARIGADAAQDKVIKQVNDNLVASVNTINKNVADGFTALNQAGANEAAAREAKDNELNERITNEANAIHDEIKAGDKVLDDRITNVKEYLEKQTSDNYVSKADAAVQDGAVVKAANTIGDNVTKLDAALAKETAARLGADAAQDKVIEQVNQNMVDGFNTINKNVADGFTALNNADLKEAQERAAADTALDDKITAETSARVAADTKLVEATNGGLRLDNDNVLQKTKTEISSTGEVTTSKEAATTLILNKGAANQVKIDSEGVTVGTSSTQMDAEGFTAGGHDYDKAGAALMSDGRIKGAKGAFTVDTDGNVASGNVTSTGTVKGKTLTDGAGASMSGGTVTGTTLTDGKATISNGNIKTNGGFIQTRGGNVNTQGGEVRTNGGKVATSGGEINTGSGAIKTVGGDILTAGGKLNTSGGDIVAGTGNISGQNITASGVLSGDSLTVANGMTGRSLTLTGGDLDAGAGTIKTTGEVDAGTLNVRGKATVKDLEVKGEFKAETLTSKLDENNYTTINGGNVTSVNSKVSVDDGRTYTSTSNLTEKGRTDTAADGTTTNVSVMTAGGSDSTISSLADKNQKSYITQNLKKILQGIQNGDNATTVDQTETGIKSTATDGENTASTNLSNKGFNTYATDGTNRTYTLQTAESLTSQIGDDGKVKSVMKADGITNNADGGTITNSAKDLVNKATGDMTNTVGGKLLNDVTGDMENKVGGNLTTTVTRKVTEDFKSDLTTTIGGNKSEEVKGTSTETVTGKKTENYNGGLETTVTGEEKHTVNGSQTNSITGDQVNTIGGKQTTTVTGDVTEDYKANLSTIVGGSQTTTVTGDSSLTAENINNTAKNKITNKALDVETEAKSSIVNKVSNDAGSNTSTQLSYETKEEMSANGKTASYLRGAAEEKSQLTDGAKKTTIDTVAGQTNTNITDGTNTSNNLQKADQAASSVTDGTNTTVVNQNAKSLASSITDGTKANNTNSTVDKSEQLIKASDTQYSATSKTATKMEDALVSGGSVIDVIKNLDDAANPLISSAVTDGTNNTGVTQTAKDITNTARNGTIANEAKNITNKAEEKLSNSAADIENTATKSITDKVGENTSWKMTDGTVVELVKDVSGKTNQITTTAADTYQYVKNGDNTLAKRTSSTNDNLNITDDTNTYTKITTATGNKQTVTDGTETASTNLTKAASNTLIKNGTQSVLNHMAADTSYTVMNENGNGSRRQQTASEILDRVTDGTDTSEVKQTASEVAASAKNISNTATDKITSQIGDGSKVKSEMTADGITNTAEGGTIYNKSKDILNEVSGDILNFAGGEIGNSATRITNITGDNTVTSDTNGTTFENKAHSTAVKEGTVTKPTISGNTITTGEAVMDYADVMKDLGVRGNAAVDGNTTLGKKGADTTLTVNSTSTFNKDVTMKENLDVEGTTTTAKLVVNNGATIKGGAAVTGGTTTDKLHVTSTATFDDIVTMKKDLSVGGNVDAASYTVKDTDIKIDKNGINAGGTKVTGLAPADISHAGSTDAVSGGQLYETNTRVSGLETRMGTVETKVDKLDGKIDKVGANAAAMANLHPLEFDEDSKWNIAAAVGSSGSETASAVGVFYRPNENVMVNASAAMGTGENMFGGGVSLRLGHGGNKAKEAQMKAAAAENKELRAKVDDLTARMDALLSVLNPNMSKDFPDVPENHWAYEAVSRLAGNGIVEGYEDGKYHGERQMTRYEMAEIIYNALSKGAKAEKKLVEEFRPELQAMAAQKKA